MLRQARLDAPGVLHHIMIRGIEHRKIFVNDRDREDFVEITPPAVGYSVERGEAIARENGYR